MCPQLVDLRANIQKPHRNLKLLPRSETRKAGKPLKTLFLNPPSFEKFDGGASSRWPATREIESYWYPVWLTYPAGMLEGARLVDASPHGISWLDVVDILKDYEFLVLFTSTVGWDGDQGMAEHIKEKYPAIKIAFVGPPVTISPDRALSECAAIDFICRREFDSSIVEYANDKPLKEILGISYKDSSGIIQHNPDRPQLTTAQLDEMPWATEVYHRDLDVTRYRVPFLLHPFVALHTTRGCPAQCTFCLWPQTLSGRSWRKRSTDDVVAEMKQAKKLFPQVKEFFFDDDTFNIQDARTIELCEKLKPLGLTWSCNSRVTTDYDTLKVMKEAGCRLLIVGFESGDPQILRNVKKCATVERARSFVNNCRALGLVIHGDFILGLPGETTASIRNTIKFAKQLDCETIQVSIAHAFPGTEFFDFVEKKGFITNKTMEDGDGHQMAHIEHPGLPVDYVMEMVHKFYGEYYFRPKAAFRIVWKAIVNRDIPRLYTEARSFMQLRAQRYKASRKPQSQNSLIRQHKMQGENENECSPPILKEVSDREVSGIRDRLAIIVSGSPRNSDGPYTAN
jgi:hopanoid biosynthesis associated radical SAM protein HpnJ